MAAVLAAHKHIIVISDEIYEYINFTKSHTSMASLPNMCDRTVTINGFSKAFAMTGWRVGYMAAPLWLAQACEKVQSQMTAATCSIAQRAALAAITGDLMPTYHMAKAYLKRRDLIMTLLSELPGFRFQKPEGAFYLFPDISDYFGKTDGTTVIHDADDFCMYILQNAHVALTSGKAFGNANCIRILYAAAEEDLKKAIARIKTAVQKLKNT